MSDEQHAAQGQGAVVRREPPRFFDSGQMVVPSAQRLAAVLAKADDLGKLTDLHTLASVHEDLAKKCNLAFDESLRLAVFRLEVERKLGAELAQLVHRGGYGSKSTRLTSIRGGASSPLPEGITKQMAAKYRALAAVPETTFRAYVEHVRGRRRLPTANGARAYSRGASPKTTGKRARAKSVSVPSPQSGRRRTCRSSPAAERRGSSHRRARSGAPRSRRSGGSTRCGPRSAIVRTSWVSARRSSSGIQRQVIIVEPDMPRRNVRTRSASVGMPFVVLTSLNSPSRNGVGRGSSRDATGVFVSRSAPGRVIAAVCRRRGRRVLGRCAEARSGAAGAEARRSCVGGWVRGGLGGVIARCVIARSVRARDRGSSFPSPAQAALAQSPGADSVHCGRVSARPKGRM